MRLVLVGPVPPPTGGIATHVTALAALLDARGYDVRIYPHRRDLARTISRNLNRGEGWALVARLAVSLERAATVHAHSMLTVDPGFASLEAFTRLMSLREARWLETIHDGRLPGRFQSWSPRDRRRWVGSLQKADCVIAVSEPLSEFLVDTGLAASKVTTISPLLPSSGTTEFAPNPIEGFFASHRPVVLGIGATVPHYDFRTLVAAYSALRRTHRTAGLVLLNSTFARDDAFASALWRDLEPLGADVRLLVDVPPAEVRVLMQDADVVVRGPAWESYGLSRVEALLAGTPVVGTAVGEQRFVSTYEHGSADSLLRALTAALRQPPAVFAEARAYFTAAGAQNLERLLAIYRGSAA